MKIHSDTRIFSIHEICTKRKKNFDINFFILLTKNETLNKIFFDIMVSTHLLGSLYQEHEIFFFIFINIIFVHEKNISRIKII